MEVNGDVIDNYFSTQNIFALGCLSGEWDDIGFNIFVMKEPDYNITMMSTFSGFTMMDDQKEEIIMVNGEVVKFRYT